LRGGGGRRNFRSSSITRHQYFSLIVERNINSARSQLTFVDLIKSKIARPWCISCLESGQRLRYISLTKQPQHAAQNAGSRDFQTQKPSISSSNSRAIDHPFRTNRMHFSTVRYCPISAKVQVVPPTSRHWFTLMFSQPQYSVTQGYCPSTSKQT